MRYFKDIILLISRIIPDRLYIKLQYFYHYKKFPNLKAPQSFNEKIQYLKLNAYKPLYSIMVDKFAVKDYVREEIGSEYVIPTLGKWNCAENIDFNSLPNQFVLKCNHNSGGLVICRDKSTLDKKQTIDKLAKSLKKNGYWYSRELPYKYVKPCIFAEQYMEDSLSKNLVVYKFFTFSGEPKIIQVIQNDKLPEESIDYFDCDWNLLNLKQNFPNSPAPLPRPETLNEMIDLAIRLSHSLPFLRIDLYEINGKVYFSEFTFYTDAGMAVFEPDSWDDTLGVWVKLPM